MKPAGARGRPGSGRSSRIMEETSGMEEEEEEETAATVHGRRVEGMEGTSLDQGRWEVESILSFLESDDSLFLVSYLFFSG